MNGEVPSVTEQDLVAAVDAERRPLAARLLFVIGWLMVATVVGGLLLAPAGARQYLSFPAIWGVAFFASWYASRRRFLRYAPILCYGMLFGQVATSLWYFGANIFAAATVGAVGIVATLFLRGPGRWLAYSGVLLLCVFVFVRIHLPAPVYGAVPLLRNAQEVLFAGVFACFFVAVAYLIDRRGFALIERALVVSRAREQAERHAREEERARIEAQARAEAVRQMSAGLAHDLNNILATAVMVLPRIERSSVTPDQSRLLGAVRDAIESGIQLVNALKTLGQNASTPTEVDLASLLTQACDLARRGAAEGFLLDLVTPPGGAFVRGDPARLYQVVFNLVHNAVRATGKAGHVCVTLEVVAPGSDGKAPGLRLLVEDDGPGVPPEVREHIFEPYVTTRAETGGSGLGLAVVAAGVAAHGGAVRLLPKGQLGGACFVVELPLHPASTPAGAPPSP